MELTKIEQHLILKGHLDACRQNTVLASVYESEHTK